MIKRPDGATLRRLYVEQGSIRRVASMIKYVDLGGNPRAVSYATARAMLIEGGIPLLGRGGYRGQPAGGQ